MSGILSPFPERPAQLTAPLLCTCDSSRPIGPVHSEGCQVQIVRAAMKHYDEKVDAWMANLKSVTQRPR